MSTRITPRTTQQTALDNLTANLSRMATLQEQLASGKSLNRPSDSPIQTVEAMQYRSDIRRNDQFQRNASDGLNWLGMADNTLTSMLSVIGRVRELTLQGMNGSTDAVQRGNIAAEVTSLRDTLIGMANTKYLDRPIFAGNAGGTAAYDPSGTFINPGSTGDVIERRIGPNQKVRVNLTGPEVFGTDGVGAAGNLFQSVNQIADDLKKYGGYIPGVRPGQPTAKFLDYIMTRLTLAGAIFLTIIAVMPDVLLFELNVPQRIAIFFGGTGMLITVGVILDTMRQIETFLLQRHYDGFLKKGRIRGRSTSAQVALGEAASDATVMKLVGFMVVMLAVGLGAWAVRHFSQ